MMNFHIIIVCYRQGCSLLAAWCKYVCKYIHNMYVYSIFTYSIHMKLYTCRPAVFPWLLPMIVWWFCLRAFVVFETEMVPRPQRPHFFVRRRFSSSTTPWICMLTMLLFAWNTSSCHVTCLMVDAICRVESHEFLYWKTSVADAGALVEKKQWFHQTLAMPCIRGSASQGGFYAAGWEKSLPVVFFFFSASTCCLVLGCMQICLVRSQIPHQYRITLLTSHMLGSLVHNQSASRPVGASMCIRDSGALAHC